MEGLAKRSRVASRILQSTQTELKNKALLAIADALEARADEIIAANQLDLEQAKVAGIAGPLFQRLALGDKGGPKFEALVTGVRNVAQQVADPVGRVEKATRLDQGLDLYRVACPVGVICVIFEARPEVVVQISALALKSGNAVILKGGKEAQQSNRVLVEIVRQCLSRLNEPAAMPADAVQLVETREQVADLLVLDQWIDLVIPRGSKQLVRYVQSNTRIPVLGHADGLCTVYLHRDADTAVAVPVCLDAKLNAPSACNAVETLLVHAEAVSQFKAVVQALVHRGVELRCCPRSLPLAQQAVAEAAAGGGQGDAGKGNQQLIVAADEQVDYDTEFLDLKLAVKLVDSLDQAVAHIGEHGSGHTDCIVARDMAVADQFMGRVDSAGVFHNASTRFADGFRYGFGAEIGVSTNRTHARGPVGVEGLLIYKYRLYGHGQTVEQFQTKQLSFKHDPLTLKLPSPDGGAL